MIEKLKEFAAPYYAGKDIMHNMWHIELVEKWINRIVAEGGKTYTAVKTLITGSLRNQSLLETLEYLKHNVIDKNQCYLPETKKMCEEMNGWARQFVTDLEEGILL